MVSDDDTRRDYYRMITAEGERLTRLINNVMEHARLRKGQRPMQVMSGDAGLLLREVLEVMTPHIESEGFELDVSIEESLPAARFDGDALKQVLFNVLDNALKYGRRDGKGRLEVCCSGDSNGWVNLSVRDHGPGIAASDLDTIFEPFYRAEDELTRRKQGTGIGLSLVRDLVERMQGRVRGLNRTPGLEVQIALRP
jgi:signal transduction histidine kinase